MSSNRIEFFDFLRGIAIIFVIGIHSFTPFLLSESSSLSYHFGIIWRQFIGCAVPLFLAISGYFMANKDFSIKQNYRSFYKKQIPKVYVPMLVWSIPYLLYSLINDTNIIKSLILFFIGGFSVYYFIILIIQYYFLLPKLQRLLSNKGGIILAISALISIVCMVVLFFVKYVKNVKLPLVVYAGIFPTWIMFFVLGLYLRKNDIKLSSNALFVLMVVGLLLSVMETYFTISFTGKFTGLGIKTGAFIYSFFAIIFMFSLNRNFSSNSLLWNLLVYIGKVSFGIYLSHTYFLRFIVRPLVSQLKIEHWIINQFLMITLAVYLSYCNLSAEENS